MSKIMRLIYAMILAMSISLVACEQEGPAERAGEEMDEAVEDTGEAMEDAGEEAQ